MKKGLIAVLVIIAVVLIAVFSLFGSYNTLVSERENVKTKYSTLDAQLQRRADLIPNLVSTVKGFNVHEKEIIDSITSARAAIASNMPEGERLEKEGELTSALAGLTLIIENYPEIQADENFRQLMDELSGTENRITVARNDYNEAVRSYNTRVLSFPSSIMARMFGFETAAYFEAAPGSTAVPEVKF